MIRGWSGAGSLVARHGREAVRDALLDPGQLTRGIPGAQSVERLDSNRFTALLSFGVGPFRSVNTVEIEVVEHDPFVFAVGGSAAGSFGTGRAEGEVRLVALPGGHTRIAWTYRGEVNGQVSRAGGPLLRITARVFCTRFFTGVTQGLA